VDGSEVVQFDGPVLELVPDARTRRLGLGPDVLGPSFDAGVALRRLRARGGEIGDALLDQRALAGIGNVWKCEACFAARVDPWADVASVADADALALLAFAREGMQASVGGAPRPGAVHARAGLPCPVCATQIRVRGQGDGARATFWCPGCQGSEAGGRAPRASPEPRRQ
jgi:endonuclease-8